MKTIYKYNLETTDVQEIKIYKGYQSLKVGYDGQNKLCLWALVESKNKTVKQTFYLFETGHQISNISKKKYIGTVKDLTSKSYVFIWHI